MLNVQNYKKLYTIAINDGEYCQGVYDDKFEAEEEAMNLVNSQYFESFDNYLEMLECDYSYAVVKEILL